MDSKQLMNYLQYGYIPRSEPIRPNFDFFERKIEALLIDEIKDIDAGIFFSGGIDSSLIAAIKNMHSKNNPVRCYTLALEDDEYNESGWAKRIAGYLGIELRLYFLMDSEIPLIVQELPKIYKDSPFANSSAIATTMVAKMAADYGEKIILSGDGGDELFGQYDRYKFSAKIEKIPYVFRKPMSFFLSILPIKNEGAFNRKLTKAKKIMREKNRFNIYQASISCWGANEIQSLFKEKIKISKTRVDEAWRIGEDFRFLQRAMFVDLEISLPDDSNIKMICPCKYYGMEVKFPFQSQEMKDLSFSVPSDLKRNKKLLKSLLNKYIPKYLFDRPKRGFGVPLDKWLRGCLKEMMLDYLSTERLKKEGVFNTQIVEKKISDHLKYKANNQYQLWALLMYEMWKDENSKNNNKA